MGKIFTVANRKGGCAKTTTTGALCSGLSRLGYKVLAVDCDPQGNLSNWFKIDGSKTEGSTYEVITGKMKMKEAIVQAERFDLLPACNTLSLAETELMQAVAGQSALKKAIKEVKDDYDFIFIDTPPSLGIITTNAFVAASDGVILCTDAGMFAMNGMVDLAKILKDVEDNFNENAKVIGILMCRFNPRYNAMKTMAEVTEQYSQYFDAPIYKTFIRQSVGIMESQMESEDIFDSPRKHAAYEDYKTFVLEFVKQQTGEDKESF